MGPEFYKCTIAFNKCHIKWAQYFTSAQSLLINATNCGSEPWRLKHRPARDGLVSGCGSISPGRRRLGSSLPRCNANKRTFSHRRLTLERANFNANARTAQGSKKMGGDSRNHFNSLEIRSNNKTNTYKKSNPSPWSLAASWSLRKSRATWLVRALHSFCVKQAV